MLTLVTFCFDMQYRIYIPHLALRQTLRKCLDALPKLYESHRLLTQHNQTYMTEKALALLLTQTSPSSQTPTPSPDPTHTGVPTATAQSEATKQFTQTLQVGAFASLMIFMTHHLLVDECERRRVVQQRAMGGGSQAKTRFE
jgi:hypothetical protein